MALCHAKSKGTRSSKLWYVLKCQLFLGEKLMDELRLGTRYKSFHQATFIGSVQKDPRNAQEAACVCSDGRVL